MTPVATSAGRYRHRLEVQSLGETRADDGGIIRGWTTDTTRWAEIKPLQGRELFEQQQVDSRLTHRIEMRYVAGLTSDQRLVEGSRIFNIHSVTNVKEIDRITVVMAITDDT